MDNRTIAHLNQDAFEVLESKKIDEIHYYVMNSQLSEYLETENVSLETLDPILETVFKKETPFSECKGTFSFETVAPG